MLWPKAGLQPGGPGEFLWQQRAVPTTTKDHMSASQGTASGGQHPQVVTELFQREPFVDKNTCSIASRDRHSAGIADPCGHVRVRNLTGCYRHEPWAPTVYRRISIARSVI